MKLPLTLPFDVTKDIEEVKDDISAIRAAVERLVAIEEARKL